MHDHLWSLPIEALAPEIAQGRLSPVDLVEACLNRIETHDTTIASFVCIADDAKLQAEKSTKEIREGRYRGPLHGVPIAVKDNYLTSDMPTHAGTAADGVRYECRDSTAVGKLRSAGAIIIGKTRMHEFAWGNETPPTRNPWDINRVPGGSSGGSGAAIAAGFVPAALGSDTGGSIRIPASLCGTVGIKPTFGLIGRDGIVPHSWSLDHAGPLSATVTDAAILLNILTGPDSNDPGSAMRAAEEYGAALEQPIRGMRVGVCRNHFFEGLETDVENAIEAAIGELASQGAKIVELEVPNLAYGLGAIFAIELASSTAWHDPLIKKGLTAQYQPDVRSLVEMGRFITAADYLKAEQFRRLLIEDFSRVYEDVDVIVGPTTPLTAWRIGERSVKIEDQDESVLAASWRLTYPWNLTGAPAISLPCGFDNRNLPISLQISAKPFDEQAVFRIASAYERRQDWKGQRAKLIVPNSEEQP